MPGFDRFSTYASAMLNGKVHTCSFRKAPSQTSTAGWWVDLSMAAGNPKPNYYASDPLVAAQLNGLNGIFHGDDASPAEKYLHNLSVCSPNAGLVGQYRLLDYLLYYPFVDLDSGDEQVFDNAITLPRYTDGRGVMAMLVAVAPTVGGGSFTFNYTDHAGNAKTSPTISCSTAAANIASIVTSEQATAAGGRLFLPLASGSAGIRRIDSLTMASPAGGLASVVLVKPLAEFAIREINVASEFEFASMRTPAVRIQDGAYLNLVMNCAGTVASGTLTGFANFAIGE
jgi:hypothetical protein